MVDREDERRARLARSWLCDLELFAAFRVFVASYFLLCAIVIDWSLAAWQVPTRRVEEADFPAVYLTVWGVVAETIYFILAAFVTLGEGQRQSGRGEWAGIKVAHRALRHLFGICACLAPAISIVYWVFIFPSDGRCNFFCTTAHLNNTLLMLTDVLLCQMQLEAAQLPAIFAYPAFWFSTQYLWVRCGHPPVYAFLRMTDAFSLLFAGGFAAVLLANFKVLQALTRLRDRRLVAAAKGVRRGEDRGLLSGADRGP